MISRCRVKLPEANREFRTKTSAHEVPLASLAMATGWRKARPKSWWPCKVPWRPWRRDGHHSLGRFNQFEHLWTAKGLVGPFGPFFGPFFGPLFGPFFGPFFGPYFWVNYNELTTSSLEIIVSKGNHPQMALIQVSELIIVIYPDLWTAKGLLGSFGPFDGPFGPFFGPFFALYLMNHLQLMIDATTTACALDSLHVWQRTSIFQPCWSTNLERYMELLPAMLETGRYQSLLNHYWLVVWNMNFMNFHMLGIIIPTVTHSYFSEG